MDLSPHQLDAVHDGYKILTAPPDASGSPRPRPRRRGEPKRR